MRIIPREQKTPVKGFFCLLSFLVFFARDQKMRNKIKEESRKNSRNNEEHNISQTKNAGTDFHPLSQSAEYSACHLRMTAFVQFFHTHAFYRIRSAKSNC